MESLIHKRSVADSSILGANISHGLTVCRCENKEEWNDFVRRSPQGTIYSTTEFMEAIGLQPELWIVKNNGRPGLGAVVLKESGRLIRAPFPFTMYQGVLATPDYDSMPPHSRFPLLMRMTDSLLVILEQNYSSISLCFHHSTVDLRSFSWFHYHQPELGRFEIILHYTGLLDLAGLTNFDEYVAGIRELRRRDRRKAEALEYTIEESSDVEGLNRLHGLTLDRQGLQRTAHEQHVLIRIAQFALEQRMGTLLACRDREGKIVAMTLFLYDHRCGYYCIGANDPEHRNGGAGTYLMLENIRLCWKRGCRFVDFVGVNSPNRGDYKISFNAVPTPYYVAAWQKPCPGKNGQG